MVIVSISRAVLLLLFVIYGIVGVYGHLSTDENIASSLFLTIVSTATLAPGSMDMHSSKMASDIISQSLSGWPSDTDSEVKRYVKTNPPN